MKPSQGGGGGGCAGDEEQAAYPNNRNVFCWLLLRSDDRVEWTHRRPPRGKSKCLLILIALIDAILFFKLCDIIFLTVLFAMLFR